MDYSIYMISLLQLLVPLCSYIAYNRDSSFRCEMSGLRHDAWMKRSVKREALFITVGVVGQLMPPCACRSIKDYDLGRHMMIHPENTSNVACSNSATLAAVEDRPRSVGMD